ncbi:MAG: LemA family protein [Lachnospiraceae bacterium]|nr:LemA family protein [Lachnospiraceae bacterium]
MIGWIIGGVVVVAVLAFVIVTYNNLVLLRNKVKNSFAQIDTQLQRRFDLIPNLVETVKGFATHEKELLENVAASRSGYMNATSNGEKLAMNNQLTSNLRSLFAVAESYPDLKSNTNFLRLQDELSETEDKITYSRQFYNDAVTIYNNKIQMFPSNLVAGMFGFREEELFNTDDEAKEAPRVQF